MNELQSFSYQEKEVRTVQVDDSSWFVLSDVCKILGIGNTADVAKRLDEDEVDKIDVVDSVGRRQRSFIISESGLYNVILRSDKQEAKKFRKWVTSEVLPTIRKHGAYMTRETLQAAITDPDYLLQIVTALKTETDKRKALEAANSRLTVENQIMQPKAEYFDTLVDRSVLTNFRETAKELGIPPRTFTKFLLDHKYVYRDKRGKLLPYEAKNKGFFEVKECINDKSGWQGVQTLITPKGRDYFLRLGVV